MKFVSLTNVTLEAEALFLLHAVQVCIHGIRGESTAKHVVYDLQTSGLESPRVTNMMELEIPLVMENDGNVEKAEAYAKELDDVSIQGFIY